MLNTLCMHILEDRKKSFVVIKKADFCVNLVTCQDFLDLRPKRLQIFLDASFFLPNCRYPNPICAFVIKAAFF